MRLQHFLSAPPFTSLIRFAMRPCLSVRSSETVCAAAASKKIPSPQTRGLYRIDPVRSEPLVAPSSREKREVEAKKVAISICDIDQSTGQKGT